MIGIISTSMNSFIIMDKIRKKYKNIDIYIYTNDLNIEDKVHNLINKGCKIIIVDSINKKWDYLDVFFIDVSEVRIDINNSYSFSENDVVKWIEQGNQKMILDYLRNIKIDDDKVIVLRDIRMIFIKNEIIKFFSSKIVDSLDIMMMKIDDYINMNKINFNNNGISRYLIDE